MRFSLFLSILFINQIKNAVPDRNEPLIVTDYLNSGQVELARQLSSVEPFVGNVESYSGYFRVSDDCVRNMFFWYFKAENGNASAPVIVWLNGGPGSPSVKGLFTQIGPYYVNEDLTISRRKISWTEEYNVIFIDNPVGVGFSFSAEECFLSDEDMIGRSLSICMQQFYQLFPELKPNPLYLTGLSYAGKYIPAMAYAIDKWNLNSPDPINLKGMAIGGAWIDPYASVDYGTTLFYCGLIFDNQIEKFDKYRDIMREGILREDYLNSTWYFDEFMEGDTFTYPTFYTNMTGLFSPNNFRYDSPQVSHYSEFLRRNSKKINAGNVDFDKTSMRVNFIMSIDLMKTIAPVFKYLVNSGYKTILFNGQLDPLVGPPHTAEFLRNFEWNGKEVFNVAPQQIWYSQTSPKRVNGYVRASGNFKHIVIRNAGHLVPTDQPEASLEMMRNFINDFDF